MRVENRTKLLSVLKNSKENQIAIDLQHNDYGIIKVDNKHNIEFYSSSYSPLKINLIIQNKSSNITIKNLNLASSESPETRINKKTKKPYLYVPFIIQSLNGTKNITISNCILSSYAVEETENSKNTKYKTPENNTLTELDVSEGNLPTTEWVSGVNMRCKNGLVKNNIFTKLKVAMQAGSAASCSKCEVNTIESNLVQFFSEDGIRGIGHNVHINNNRIFDPILFDGTLPENNNHQDAIQIFPTRNTYCGGVLENISITNNEISVIKGASLDWLGTCLQGIFASDGYLKSITIKGNTVAVNSAHGISINGPYDVLIEDNTVLLLQNSYGGFGCQQGPTTNSDILEHPGLKLNYTRTCNGRYWVWRDDKKFKYSVTILNNNSPCLLIPERNTQEELDRFVVTRFENTQGKENTFIAEGYSDKRRNSCPKDKKCQ